MNDMDFIPATYHHATARRRSARTQVLWGVGMAAVMAAWLWVHGVEMARAQDQLQAVRVEQEQLSARKRFFDELVSERVRLQARDAVQEAVNDSASWVVVMAELSTLLPDGALLTDIAIDAGEELPAVRRLAVDPAGAAVQSPGMNAAPAPASKGWPRLKLVGAAPSNVLVSTFTARLGGSPLFRDVQTGMVKDAVVAAHKVRQFEVDCLVVPQTGGAR